LPGFCNGLPPSNVSGPVFTQGYRVSQPVNEAGLDTPGLPPGDAAGCCCFAAAIDGPDHAFGHDRCAIIVFSAKLN
jgi:hypothetical protein